MEKIEIELKLEEIKTESGITVNRITEKLHVHGDLDEDQINRLKTLIPKCPIARVVTGPVEIMIG